MMCMGYVCVVYTHGICDVCIDGVCVCVIRV